MFPLPFPKHAKKKMAQHTHWKKGKNEKRFLKWKNEKTREKKPKKNLKTKIFFHTCIEKY